MDGDQVTPCSGEDELTSRGDSDTEPGWEALLAAAQAGDGRAYRTLLQDVLPFVRAVARRRLPSEDGLEDVAQDALLTLHRVRHTYRPGHPVKPWLAAIVTRRAIDAVRRRSRIGTRELSDPHAYETFADDSANREDAAEAAEAVPAMLAQLTPKEREAVELVKLKELTLVEASAVSGQSVASLKVNVHRAIRRLRRGAGEVE